MTCECDRCQVQNQRDHTLSQQPLLVCSVSTAAPSCKHPDVPVPLDVCAVAACCSFGTLIEWYANNPKDTPDYLIGGWAFGVLLGSAAKVNPVLARCRHQ